MLIVTDFVLFLVVLGSLLLCHELGHFIAAKLCKVRVDEFGIGFPPRIISLFEAWGTKFTLNLIPFGGFNRIAGEDDPEVPDGLAASSKRARTFILSAGSLANVLLGFMAFVFAFIAVFNWLLNFSCILIIYFSKNQKKLIKALDMLNITS